MGAVPGLAAHHCGGAVAADIVEGADCAVLAANNEGALAQHVQSRIGAGLGDLADVANDLPAAQQQMASFEIEELGVAVGPTGQRLAAEGDCESCTVCFQCRCRHGPTPSPEI